MSLTHNLDTKHGLFNGAAGTIEHVLFENEGISRLHESFLITTRIQEMMKEKNKDKLSFEKHEQQQDSYNCGIITIMQSFMLGRYSKLDKLGIYGGHNEFNEIRKQLGAYIYKRCSNKTVLENAVNESILNANM